MPLLLLLSSVVGCGGAKSSPAPEVPAPELERMQAAVDLAIEQRKMDLSRFHPPDVTCDSSRGFTTCNFKYRGKGELEGFECDFDIAEGNRFPSAGCEWSSAMTGS